ncbi:DUF4129 domain-containing protein [Paenibacillus sp. N4]|uniref:DUF4129 domain-containing protein n=1 Tax=Paenibacillus vietnamensis TaxID=2590547 RepID=UPI001CD0A260|nr:DUF4129 domain-containing protein [Paenibacillus vietnamensis]MCA0758000.1 DUF4129 domain-containing protein [Paenibacillus vietnamensis]
MSRVRSESPLIPLLKGMLEVFYFLPVLLAAAVYVLPTSQVWAWIATLPLCYGAAALMIAKLTQIRLIGRYALTLGIGAVHALLLYGMWSSDQKLYSLIITFGIGALAASRGASMVLHGWTMSFPNLAFLSGIASYAVFQPLKLFMLQKAAAYNPLLVICGIAAVVLFFFLANERHLDSETVDTAATPATAAFKRQNRILVFILSAIMVVLALFRQIQQAVEGWFRSLFERLADWLNRPPKEPPVPEQPPEQAPPVIPGAEETGPPPEWMTVLEQLLKVAAIVLLAAGAVFLLTILLRKLYGAAKKLMARLLEREADRKENDAGYTDEIEHFMSLTKLGKQIRGQLKSLLPQKSGRDKGWKELASDADKIRFIYARLLRKQAERGHGAPANHTPREVGQRLADAGSGGGDKQTIETFIGVYERVRYGEKQPGSGQAEQFKNQLLGDKPGANG